MGNNARGNVHEVDAAGAASVCGERGNQGEGG